MLEAVAGTLRLEPYERSHLFTLAGALDPAPFRESPTVPPEIELMLRQLEPYPACVKNARTDILAFNRTYDRVVGGLSDVPFEDRNSTLMTFARPAWRDRIVDLADKAPLMVANLRAAMARHTAEPAWKNLVRRLRTESPEFARMWEQHDVRPPENLRKEFLASDVGLLRLRYTRLWFGPCAETYLTTYTPDDEESAAKLRHLHQLALAAHPDGRSTATTSSTSSSPTKSPGFVV